MDIGADVLTGVNLAACCRVHCQLEARRALGIGGAAVECSSHSSLEFIAFALLVTSDKSFSPVSYANGCGIVLPFVVRRAIDYS